MIMNEKTENKGLIGMLVIVMVGMVVTMLNQSIINIALPQIMVQLKIDATTSQWLSTGFMLVSGILIPVSAYLVQKFSYRQIFITAMTFFAIGSFICGIATTFPILMTGRIIQAIGGGVLTPLTMNIFMFAFPPEKRGSAMGILGLGMILAPALGPTICGYVIESHNWNVLFYAMVILSIAVVLFALFFFKSNNQNSTVKLDVVGTILSTVGFGALLYGVSEAGAKGWGSTEVITFLIVSVIALTILVLYELKRENPLLEMRVFKDFNFSFTLMVSMILNIALFGGMLLLPIYLQTIRGYSPLDSGLLLLPGSLVMGLMGVVTGRLFDKVGIKPLAIIGITIMSVVTYMLSKLSMDTSYTQITILYTVRSFGLAFVMMPMSSAGLMTITPKMMPYATALQSTLRQIAGSVGTAILVVVMSDQAKKYIINLGTAVTAESGKLAVVHGIDVAFFVSMIIGLVSLVLCFFFKKPKVA
jgi:EmrB/QacA subfamily drug resistance transporter